MKNGLRHNQNAHLNGHCARMVLSPDGAELLYVNDRGEFSVEPVGAPSYGQALRMATRLAAAEGVMLEVSQ